MSTQLRRYLDDKLMTSKAFAKLANINQATLWTLFNGRKITRLTALKIQKATNGVVKIEHFGFEK